jgi:hypothetical protein
MKRMFYILAASSAGPSDAQTFRRPYLPELTVLGGRGR